MFVAGRGERSSTAFFQQCPVKRNEGLSQLLTPLPLLSTLRAPSGQQIKEMAAESGLPVVATFVRTFKRETGRRPTEIRDVLNGGGETKDAEVNVVYPDMPPKS